MVLAISLIIDGMDVIGIRIQAPNRKIPSKKKNPCRCAFDKKSLPIRVQVKY